MQYLSLFELNSIIKETLSAQLAPSYWVVAEISEIRVAQKGHCYLDLIEKEGNTLQAKLKATIWSQTFRNISGWFEAVTGEALKPGMKVLANLTVDFHELYGLSANIKDIDPKFTLGERARRKQEIIDRLVAEGVFDRNKMLALPQVPQRVAVISSPTAAGYGDFMHQLQHNEYRYHFCIDLFKAVMQGCDSPPTIIKALHDIHKRQDAYDLVVIIRGGGAQADMDCFDDYELACHVAQFPIPVITGIGHERDESVTDLVAHTKLKTPTAVSAFLISAVANFDQKLNDLIKKIDLLTRNFCLLQDYKLTDLFQNLLFYKDRYLEKQSEQIAQMQYRFHIHSKRKLELNSEKCTSFLTQIKAVVHEFIRKETQKTELISNTLKLSDPELILKKGYTISYIDDKLVKDAQVEPGKVMVTKSKKLVIESIIKDKFLKKHGEEEF